MPKYVDVDVMKSKIFCDNPARMDLYKTLMTFIDHLPEADVTPVVHAHWKDGRCTNCGTPKFVVKVVRGFDEVIYEYEGKANYCPNCGAKMDERKDYDKQRHSESDEQ